MAIFTRLLRISLCIALGLVAWLGTFFSAHSATADRTPVKQTPIEVRVHMGNSADDLMFFPNQLEFEAGRRYKLILDNLSPEKHYFTAKDFADNIWTQKVEAGQVEVKGAIHELELKPTAEAEWFFVALKPGTYELHCSIPGHAEAGMQGTIAINSFPGA
ncbi:cupredoxin domain-containing protein [Oculatella sp. LEGE 06141]|uniref:cupredoxin domain-containing protein n=1 Tax=Oculatella sp. LEGE 06141 TaxID=1828648 RepID=UPI0018809413|nr:cupredoxin domain-containing protein [Oculatella sp. LEGE 06141]MBE9181744.1 cupredoxin domain-containing protein [Oculatella sp. LEGE 06141]